MLSQNQQQHPSMLSPTRWAFNAAMFVVSIFSMPAELAMRRNHGTRYFNPMVFGISYVVMGSWLMLAGVMDKGTGITTAALGVPFIALVAWRSFSLIRDMVGFRDAYSYHDGDSVLPWRLLPGGERWMRTRLLYEPGALFLFSLLLKATGLASWSLSGFFAFSAVMLWFKGAGVWFLTWEQVRDVLDAKFMARDMSRTLKDPSGVQLASVAPIAPLTFARGLPLAAQQEIAADMHKRLPEEYQALITELEPNSGTVVKDSAPDGMADLAGLLSPVEKAA